MHGVTLQFGHLSWNFLAIPVIVPPVPAPSTTMSTLSINTEFSKVSFLYQNSPQDQQTVQ